MCGRHVIIRSAGDLGRIFEVRNNGLDLEFAPDYNIAPTREVPAVWQDEDGRRLELARWGLVLTWAKEVGVGVRAFNARIETAAEKPTFRSAFAKRRCLLSADGYYEWKKLGSSAKPAKQPYFIHPPGSEVIAFAGLHESWRSPEQEWVHSVSILTGPAPAAGVLAEIHDRVPLSVAPARFAAWLDPDLRDREQIRGLLDIGNAPNWIAQPVGAEVGNVRNNGPELIATVTAD
jgi:putative SOS response-associated peptidase YedK